MSAPRSDYIKAQLDHHFMDMSGVAVSTPTEELWRALADGLGPQAVYGWSWPIDYDDPAMLVPYCPEIIAEQTKHLTDDELEAYLKVIEWVCDGHCRLWFDEDDPAERQRRVEEEMYERFPGSLDIWNAVQLAALDHCTR